MYLILQTNIVDMATKKAKEKQFCTFNCKISSGRQKILIFIRAWMFVVIVFLLPCDLQACELCNLHVCMKGFTDEHLPRQHFSQNKCDVDLRPNLFLL